MQYLGKNKQTKLIDKVESLCVKKVGLTKTQYLHQNYQNNNKRTQIMDYNNLHTLDKIN